MAITLSLCMIVKNEQANLPCCLDCVKHIADEINIVDTGSTDATVDIARTYTDRVFHFDWVYDFSAARNFSFGQATMDYILWLDADDIITPENQQKLIKLKKSLSRSVDYVLMPYHYSHDENGRVTSIQTRERIVKRAKGFVWQDAIHETINTSGNSLMSDIFITHRHTHFDATAQDGDDPTLLRNHDILKKAIDNGDRRWRTWFYYGTGLFGLKRYDEAMEALTQLFALPNDSLTCGLDAYIVAHKIYLQRGDHENALKILLDHENLLKDKAEFYCELAAFYQNELKQPDVAADYYSKALGCRGHDRPGVLIERNEDFYYFIPLGQLGLILLSVGMNREAVYYLEKALEYYPNHEKTMALVQRIKSV